MPRYTRRRATLKPRASAEGAVDVDVEEDAVSAPLKYNSVQGKLLELTPPRAPKLQGSISL
jgi:hypothetical protein